ncbi:MAG TPA: ABC transporter permease [Candidatus Polarisedimenticolaceae bacterium]
MKKILAVALKELRQIRRDPLSLAMLVGVPAMMLLLYGYALNFDVKHVALAVQDNDKTRASRALVDAFVRSTYFDLAVDLPAGADLERVTERRRAKAILVIPEGFGDDLESGRNAPVQMLVDGTDSQTATTLLGYAQGVVESRNRAIRVERYGEGAPGTQVPIEYRPRVWYNPDLESTQFLVPGLIGFILMLTAVVSMALSVVREKERGTMEQLRVTALRPGQLILGKVLPFLGISLLATIVILVTARLLFGVEIKGPYLHLFAVTLLYLLGALGWGLFVSSLADTQAMAFQVGTISSMLPAIFLSGFIFPIRSMPEPLQWVTYAVPARYYLIALRGIILKGEGLGPYLEDVLFLAAYATIILTLAWVRLVKRGN